MAKSLDGVLVKLNRPGAEGANDNIDERKEASDFCILRRNITVPKSDGSNIVYLPTPAELEEARTACRGLRNLWRLSDPNRLDQLERKSLSAFSFGTNEFLLPPTLATQVLSCLTDPSDITSLTNTVNISSSSIRFLIDNQRISVASWACESSCFANNPQPDLQAGLGEMEIKPESLRFIVCANNDLLADSAFNIESWILRKVSDAVRVTMNNVVVAGDGVGKPMGFLSPAAGIPILDTSPSTPAGQITWQDLVSLKYDLPMQWHTSGAYFMNQRTWALLATMSDALGRPLFAPSPIQNQVGLMLNGSPVVITTQMLKTGLPG